MQKITPEFVTQLNIETDAGNFESVVGKYGLDTPIEYAHTALCEQDGVEVWGVTENKSILVYDNNSGWYLLPLYQWIEEIRNVFEDEADQILSEIPALNQPDKTEDRLRALEEKLDHKYPKVSSIQASGELKEALDELKDGEKDSYEKVIWRLIIFRLTKTIEEQERTHEHEE